MKKAYIVDSTNGVLGIFKKKPNRKSIEEYTGVGVAITEVPYFNSDREFYTFHNLRLLNK